MKLKINFAEFLKSAFWNDEKYTTIAAGRQTGKTYNAVIWLVVSLLKHGGAGLWVDTTQTNLDKYVELYFSKIFKGIWGMCHYDKIAKTIRLPNDSYIHLRSAERPELMEGFAYEFVVLNEAGIILKKPNLWYNTILPMTKKAKVKFIGTPKGKNLFHKLHHQNEPDFAHYTFSAYDSPFWTKEALDKIKTQIPSIVFSQEFLAEFAEDQSSVFKNIDNCVEDYQLPLQTEDSRFYMGVDLAKFTDFTVITVLNDKGKLVYHDRFNQLDYTFQKTKILEIAQKYNAYVMIDATGVGVAIFDDLKRQLYDKLQGFQFTSASKKELIEDLMLAFEHQRVTIPRLEVLLSEIEVFEYQITRSGNISYNAPGGFHDDCVISLALAYQLVKTIPEPIDISFI